VTTGWTEPARRLPVLATPEVLVVGGGAAGVGAASAAARAGAETLLIERMGFLGGTLTAVTLGGLCGAFRHVGPEQELRPVIGGLWDELRDRLHAADALGAPRRSAMVRGVHGIPYDPERLKRVLDEMLAAHGARVLTGCAVSSVAAEDGRITAVVVETAAGRAAILPRMVVDASGDAEVVARAGGAFAVAPGEVLQSPSAMFSMAPVDMPAFAAVPRPEVNRLLEASGLPLPRTMIAAFPYLAPGQVHLNATRIRRPDGTAFDTADPWDRAAAEAEGRRQTALYEAALRQALPGFAEARVVASGAVLGVRESRRIAGEATLTEADVMSGAAADERIACCAWPIEDHAPGRSTVWRPLPDGAWYGIPYGALLPVGFANLLAAGRCLSADHAAQASARISLACLAMGEAAGIAAALGRAARARPDVARVQASLRREGAILDPA
jgi:2-polyprenyl-6-methoxyphenol hydroxylase-like FAD-dependent oxidoreductase